MDAEECIIKIFCALSSISKLLSFPLENARRDTAGL